MMPEDLKELLRAFNDHGVKYLIVGGYAFRVHAEPRATKDLDIFIRADEQNSQAVFRALAQYGAPLASLSSSDFMDGATFQIGQPPARIDILQRIDGVTFDEAWKNRLEGLIDGQIRAAVISRATSSGINWRLGGNKTFWMLRRCVLPNKMMSRRHPGRENTPKTSSLFASSSFLNRLNKSIESFN